MSSILAAPAAPAASTPADDTARRPPHELNPEETLSGLRSGSSGLSSDEASRRLLSEGPNELARTRGTPMAIRFVRNFYHTFALLLWAGAALAFIGRIPELGWAIIAVIVINGVFSFWQEYAAEKATEALRKLLPTRVSVMRDSELVELEASRLVPGDVIALEEGDSVPADGRLLTAQTLMVDNSSLTGESQPQRRSVEALSRPGMRAVDAENMVFAGTSVARGRGTAVVTSTGMKTEFGAIARLTSSVAESLSPLQLEVNRIAGIIAILAVVLGVVFFAAGAGLAALPLSLAFIFAIGMIVANVPEGLLPTVTLSLAVAVRRMARSHALVKRLSAVETLGSATVICTDKTGTLTENQMTVRGIWTAAGEGELSGAGYAPQGGLEWRGGGPGSRNADGAVAEEVLRELTRAARLCNNARLVEGGILGDPTEGALLVAAEKLSSYVDGHPEGGSTRSADRVSAARMESDSATRSQHPYKAGNGSDLTRVYELPFDSGRKRMSVIVQNGGGLTAYVKGAPVETVALCRECLTPEGPRPLDDELRQAILAANDEYARAGLRVLALARRRLPAPATPFEAPNAAHYDEAEVEAGLTFIGLMAMLDPPRPEVAEAIETSRKAGVKTILITGDYALTAESIARRIGLIRGHRPAIINGSQLTEMSDGELDAALREDEVIFARAAPEQKMRIAARLQAQGQVVAMTGDGVNDAPALRQADVGVAMGVAGTDVARQAADIVLTDDDFSSIVRAIREGRVVFDNIRKFVSYIFAHLTPEAVPFAVMALTGNAVPLGLTVIQILAIDLGTETLPALALGVEKGEPDVMERPPRRDRRLVDRGLLFRAYIYLGLIEAALVMTAFLYVLYSGGWEWGMPDISRPESPLHHLYVEATTMTFLGIVGAQIGTVVACRTESASIFSMGLFSNKWVLWGVLFEVAVTAALMYIPPVASVLGMAPLGPLHWLAALSFAVVIVIADEARKYIRRRK